MLKTNMFAIVGLVVGLSSSAMAADASVMPIVGGTSVPQSSVIAHRVVALFFMTTTNQQAACSGSILNDSQILTAAHCVANFKQGLVIFSTSNMLALVQSAFKNGLSAVPQARLMTGVKQEPGFPGGEPSGDGEFNDLAVVTFQGGLPAGYEPAKFLDQASALAVLQKGAPVTLAGYGITSPPKQQPGAPTQQTFMTADPNQGVGTLREVAVQATNFSAQGIDLFVAGPAHHDACSGDSGGPSMVVVGGETYVVGVASRSDCVQTSIYTFVDTAIVSSI
jgi:secreted trypsin-like serine protease